MKCPLCQSLPIVMLKGELFPEGRFYVCQGCRSSLWWSEGALSPMSGNALADLDAGECYELGVLTGRILQA